MKQSTKRGPSHAALRKAPHKVSHPYANAFPLMEGVAFEALVADIRQHGLREPITIDREDRVLDGRNRLRACIVAQIPPRYVLLEPHDVSLSWVVSRNLHRRHLTDAQRAAVAAELANLPVGAPPRVRSKLKENSAKLPNSQPLRVSQAEAAKAMQVSTRSVTAAVARKRELPTLHEVVKTGKITVADSNQIAGLPFATRSEVMQRIADGDRELALKIARAELNSRHAGDRERRHRFIQLGLTKLVAWLAEFAYMNRDFMIAAARPHVIAALKAASKQGELPNIGGIHGIKAAAVTWANKQIGLEPRRPGKRVARKNRRSRRSKNAAAGQTTRSRSL